MRSDFKNETGNRYGRLTVISYAPMIGVKNHRWECRCDCGKKTMVQGGILRAGIVVSCGCYHKEIIKKHGMEKTLIYTTWAQMKSRCKNQKNKHYYNYGGRGISVCERWMKFENFYADMGDKPKGLSLDRINNDGNYEPSNCRWADNKQQCNNKRTCHYLQIEGQSKTVTEWAKIFGISAITVRSRLKLGWSDSDALMKPVDSSKSTKRKFLIH